MKIKDISVRTVKNHIETEISFEPSSFKEGCYLIQSVFLSFDRETEACQMVAGIPSIKVLTSADATPAFPSTEKKEYPYSLVTKVLDADDNLIEERRDVFYFSLPSHESPMEHKSFFRKVFGK